MEELFAQVFSAFVGGPLPDVIDHVAVIVGVIGGAIFACDRRLDIVGVICMGLITGYGGGVMRDLLLQDKGIYFMQHPMLVFACIVVCIAVFYFRRGFHNLDPAVYLLDTLSVGLFAAAGAEKTLVCGGGPMMAFILGALTSVGGGALRDVFAGEIPAIFKQGNFYALAGIAGSASYVILVELGVPAPAAVVVCIAVTTALRYLSVYFNWVTKTDPIDLTPYVSRPLKRGAVVAKNLVLAGRIRKGPRAKGYQRRE